MTLTTTASEITYTGDGVTQLFPVPFYWLADADLKVYQTPVATGVVTLLTLTTNYSVSGSGNPAGGSVTLTVAPAVGDRLVILRDPPATQLTDLQSNDAFPAATVETTFDKLTMLVQRLQARVSRTIGLANGVPSIPLQLPGAVANNLLGWNPTANGLVNVDPLTLGPGTAGSTTFIQQGAGAVSRSVQDRLRETFSVRDYGAVGNGIADDTAAIQACINAAVGYYNNGANVGIVAGGTVSFPPGQFKVTSTLIVPSTIRIVGSGSGNFYTGGLNSDQWGQGTILVAGAANMTVLQVNVPGTTGVPLRSSVVMEHFAVQGCSVNFPASITGHGIWFNAPYLTSAILPHVDDVHVNGAAQHGIYFDGNVFEGSVTRCQINQNKGDGIRGVLDSSGLPGEILLQRNTCDFNVGRGVNWSGGGTVWMYANTVSYNAGGGTRISACQLGVFGHQMELNGGTENFLVDQCYGPSLHHFTWNAAGSIGTPANIGLSFTSTAYPAVYGFFSNSSGGQVDMQFDANCSRPSINNYTGGGFVDRITNNATLGSALRRGAEVFGAPLTQFYNTGWAQDLHRWITSDGGTLAKIDQSGRVFATSGMTTLTANGGALALSVLANSTTLTGATTDAASTLPAGAVVVASAFYVSTAITGAGVTSWSAGPVGNATALVNATGGLTLASTKQGLGMVTAATTAATAIRFTANGGTFTGGVIRSHVYYFVPTPPTS